MPLIKLGYIYCLILGIDLNFMISFYVISFFLALLFYRLAEIRMRSIWFSQRISTLPFCFRVFIYEIIGHYVSSKNQLTF